MANPNFESLLPLFEASEEFSLTEAQYKNSTGVALPKDIYYLKSRSALSKLAKKYGYVVTVQERVISLKKAN